MTVAANQFLDIDARRDPGDPVVAARQLTEDRR